MGFWKKGAVESYFLITVLLAIIGFGIILYFLLNIDFNRQTEEEICKLSVLSRATSPELAQSGVPLKCGTRKVCLTQRGECSKNFAGENPEIVELSSNEQEAKKQIEKISADAILNCWKMMGEGKLDLFGSLKAQFGWEEQKPTCVICSRIAIDESFPGGSEGNVRKTLEGIDINKYMEENPVSELGVNYISALTGGGAVSYAKHDPVNVKAFREFIISKEFKLEVDGARNSEPNRELAIVFMQFKPKNTKDVLDSYIKWGGTVAGATFLSPIGIAARPIITNPIGGGLVALGIGSVVGYGMYNAYQGQLAAVNYCGPFTSNKKGIEGCSMVQGINYNFRDINKICPNIQGDL